MKYKTRKKLVKMKLWLHKKLGCSPFWRWTNHYGRRCTVCKREQHMFAFGWDLHRSWWETMRLGKHGEGEDEEVPLAGF